MWFYLSMEGRSRCYCPRACAQETPLEVQFSYEPHRVPVRTALVAPRVLLFPPTRLACSPVSTETTRHGILARMQERVDRALQDSDTAYFLDLMVYGELVVKLIVASLVAGLSEDRDGNRYRLEHRLVRADSLGEWAAALDEIFSGPAASHLCAAAYQERQELTQRFSPTEAAWQRTAVDLLEKVCTNVEGEPIPDDAAPLKVGLNRWIQRFVWLRNNTRGHGAHTSSQLSLVAKDLANSIKTIVTNHCAFKRPSAFLRRNLNGKYRVSLIFGLQSDFAFISQNPDYTDIQEGIYILFDDLSSVRLVSTDVDLSDFFVANGGFKENTYEALSYVTGRKKFLPSEPFLAAAAQLPPSETAAYPNLEVVGETFTNLPHRLKHYVHRNALEGELRTVLLDDRNPVATLRGRGGIGKTSLALEVLHQICDRQAFDAILWFSARDIDLLSEGPKRVGPDVVTEKEIAGLLIELLEPIRRDEKKDNHLQFLRDVLSGRADGGPFLLVFDNFETIHRPADVYELLNSQIRLPNKILLTTRHREFKADWPIEIEGMARDEFNSLVAQTAGRLGIQKLIAQHNVLDELFEASDGHPYIAKMFLAETAQSEQVGSFQRILARKDEVLDALFERTYQALTPAGRRVFLTLCSWRSLVPRLIIEAALIRPAKEQMDVSEAVDELDRSSLVEIKAGSSAADDFVHVPVAAAVFGRRKLAVSGLKIVIEADRDVMRQFGAVKESGVASGLEPRVERMVTALRTEAEDKELEEGLEILTYVAHSFPTTWLKIADLHLSKARLKDAENALEQFLQSQPDNLEAWRKLSQVRRRTNDRLGALEARIRLAETTEASYTDAADVANAINNALRFEDIDLEDDQKRLMVRRARDLMKTGVRSATASQLASLAWLCLHLRDMEAARKYVGDGLEHEPMNEHCLRLAERLGMSTSG